MGVRVTSTHLLGCTDLMADVRTSLTIASSVAVAATVAIASATIAVASTSLTERAALHLLHQLLSLSDDLLEVLNEIHHQFLVHNP